MGCAGNCWQAPATSEDGRAWHGAGVLWQAPGEQRLLADVGRRDPAMMPPYAALEKALSMGSRAVWQMVKDSGLRGRGGAYFPVGAKWETARNTVAERKYLLANAEEGEPGIYKDRHLMEGDPHRLVEGMQIAALGIGATGIVLFVNGEAELSIERLSRALADAQAIGSLPVPVRLQRGAGGYVLGEETAMINALHGQRSEPLARPPFPAVSGFRSSPTVINNAETLANLPDLILHGVERFRSIGSAETPGTKLVSLAGDVTQPGLYEVPLGTPLRAVIDRWGAGSPGEIGAILVGGASGSILPASLLDTPLDVRPLQEAGGILGAGGLVVANAGRCPVDLVRGLVAYNARESCGKCTPCREGTVRILDLFDALAEGSASSETLKTLAYLDDILTFGSLCGLGQMAPNPVRALLRHFPDVVREHLGGACPAGICH